MKNVRELSVKKIMKLTATEQDVLKEFLETTSITKQELIEFHLDHLATQKSCKLKYLAADYGIKYNRAEIACIIGQKLHWAKIKSQQFLKRDRPIRLEGAA